MSYDEIRFIPGLVSWMAHSMMYSTGVRWQALSCCVKWNMALTRLSGRNTRIHHLE